MPIIGYAISDGISLIYKGSFKSTAIKQGQEIANKTLSPVLLVEVTTLGYKPKDTIYPENWPKHIRR